MSEEEPQGENESTRPSGKEGGPIHNVRNVGGIREGEYPSEQDANQQKNGADGPIEDVSPIGGLKRIPPRDPPPEDAWTGVLRFAPEKVIPARLKDKFRSYERCFDPKDPFTIARQIMCSEFVHDGRLTLWRHRGAFWHWNGSYYRLVDNEALRARIWEFLDGATCPKGKLELQPFKPSMANVSNVADAMTAVALLDEHTNPPAWLAEVPGAPPAHELFACANGLLHLPTGQLYPPTPDYFCVIASTVNYDSAAPVPEQWLNFLHQLWGQDDQGSIDTLQEWFGYALSPDTSQQKIFGLIGPKRSGKGTITRVLTKLLGENSVGGPTMNSLGETFGLESLITKSLATISDVRIGARTDKSTIVERLLSISGEDQMTVARKFLKAWTGTLPTRVMLMSNLAPALPDDSGALASRFVLLALTESFYGKEDHTLTAKLTSELTGILNWAIAGYRRLHERGYFVQPKSGLEHIEAIEMLGAPVKTFIRDCCKVGPAECEKTDDLFNAWRTWCESQGRKDAGSKEWFSRNLRAAVPGVTFSRSRQGKERLMKVQGIGLGAM